MNSALISAMISILYVIIKMAIHYKESPTPNVKDGMLVFVSSMAGLYAVEQFGQIKPKITEVFTETPSF